MINVLFVCLGNICRSPLAEGIMNSQLEEAGLENQVYVSSVGTGTWHLGNSPDDRTHRIAEANGITLDSVAEHVDEKPLDKFNYILVMDESNRQDVEESDPEGANLHKIYLMREFDPEAKGTLAVPDPYMGGDHDFESVYSILSRSIEQFIKYLQQQHELKA